MAPQLKQSQVSGLSSFLVSGLMVVGTVVVLVIA